MIDPGDCPDYEDDSEAFRVMLDGDLEAVKDVAVAKAGQDAYERYARAVGWRVVGGGPMPSWAQQSPRLRAAWCEAARGALGLEPGCEPGEHGA